MKKILLVILSLGLFFACQQEAKEEWKPLDLLQYGVPITIMAPDSAKVNADDLGGGLIKDITIKGEEDYSIQLYASAAETNDIAKIKADQLAEVKANRYFSKIINEEEAGFIYETAIDSNNINYSFRYIQLKGDLECVFQTGLVGSFTQEEAQKMYEAVKPKKTK